MNRWALVSAIILGSIPALGATVPGPITTLREIHFLSSAEAAKALPVSFEATVTYYNKSDVDLFLQDDGLGVYVQATLDAGLAVGDRVLVKGHTRNSFRPDVIGDSVTVLRHGTPPAPQSADFDGMISAQFDCMRVKVRGVVRSADMVLDETRYNLYMHVLMDGGYVDATVIDGNASVLKDLLGSEIEITGVVAGKFDSKNQLTGILLEIPTVADLKIVKRADTDPESLPITPMDEILSGYHVRDMTRRIRVRGTITYFEPGSAIVLQSGDKSLWISTQSEKRERLGNLADVTGFPNSGSGSLTMTLGEIRDTEVQAPITPRPATEQELAAGTYEFNLVSGEGEVLTEVHEAAQDEYVLTSEGHVFSAVYHHVNPEGGVSRPPVKQIPIGSKIRVTGISMVTYGPNPFQGPVSFSLLLRSYDDIAVIADPSWLTVRNLTRLVSVLVVVLLAFAIRQRILERKVHRQTIALASRIEAKAALERRIAQLEHRRSRILEDINGARPLAEILEQIVDLVSFTLHDSPCWCEITDGARLGSSPRETLGRQILEQEILSHSGQVLGKMFAAVVGREEDAAQETEALTTGVRLATLAIETRQIYSDLVYRSEFDQLTDIHNRFSLDRHLDRCIEEARQKAGVFGLVYIDLDKFKLVNDQYGHHVGDLYLQEVAARMSRQLRSEDFLARLGGDEFAVLIPTVRNRGDVKEVAMRLERCFDELFAVEGYLLQGSASVGIAVYPEDGTTKDSILTSADADMYVDKQTRQ